MGMEVAALAAPPSSRGPLPLQELPLELLSLILDEALSGQPSFGRLVELSLLCRAFRDCLYTSSAWTLDLIGGPARGAFLPRLSGSEVLRRVLHAHGPNLTKLRIGSRDVRVRWSPTKHDLALVAAAAPRLRVLDVGSIHSAALPDLAALVSRCRELRLLWLCHEDFNAGHRMALAAHAPPTCHIRG